LDALNAAIYGLVQGLTEFLPVSSSGHLALYGHLSGASSEESLLLSIVVHVASLIAVLIVFRREVRRLFFEDRRLGLFICVATVPAVAAGLFGKAIVERVLASPVAVAVCLIVTGLVLIAGEWIVRRWSRSDGTEQAMGFWRVLAVGVAQAFALLPGISRSGMTISTGRVLGLSRDASVRFAFLLAVPAIAGAGCYEGLKVAMGKAEASVGAAPMLAAFVAALISSWIALVLLIKLVRRVGLWVFSPYCFVVGISVLVYYAWR
jgi:undecaprenyl-diphosphatase